MRKRFLDTLESEFCMKAPLRVLPVVNNESFEAQLTSVSSSESTEASEIKDPTKFEYSSTVS